MKKKAPQDSGLACNFFLAFREPGLKAALSCFFLSVNRRDLWNTFHAASVKKLSSLNR